ncbi:MAG: crosslink repair DNA glycosylase YcaQ family protein [Nakamurella sp.]
MSVTAGVRTLTPAQARRVSIVAQGLGRDRPLEAPPAGRAQVNRAAVDQGLLQIDSVNVLARAHYMPLYSRLGRYDTTHLDDAVWPASPSRPRLLLEAWAHEASMVPLDVWSNLWWRRRDHALGRWGSAVRLTTEHPRAIDDVLAVISERGPISAGQVEQVLEGGRGAGGWWGWSTTKTACEVLFAAGVIATAFRRGFERSYDLTERVLPAAVLAATPLPEADAKRSLVELASRRLGVGTVFDLADYFRLKAVDTAAAVVDLVADGVLEPVRVDGWKDVAYLHVGARIPRSVGGATLLCPFDPMIWFRRRTERLFDFRYRIEIYTPAEKRVYGYYVFPLLVGDALVGRFDLKADRQAGTLLVQSSWLEPGHSPEAVVPAARAELRRMADWLGLAEVVVKPRGDLALT